MAEKSTATTKGLIPNANVGTKTQRQLRPVVPGSVKNKFVTKRSLPKPQWDVVGFGIEIMWIKLILICGPCLEIFLDLLIVMSR